MEEVNIDSLNKEVDYQASLREMDLWFYWTNVDMMCRGRKSRRKARFLRKYRRLMDRTSMPCLYLNSRRLKPKPEKDYTEDRRRSFKKQISWR